VIIFYRTQTSLKPNDPNPTIVQNKYLSQHYTTIVYEKKIRCKFKVFSTSTIISYSEELEPLYIVLVYEVWVRIQTMTCWYL